MYDSITDEDLERLRQRFLSGDQSILPAHIGYFLMWFGTAEVAITTVLVSIVGAADLEKIEYLTRGMDPRVKCERLRKAAAKYKPLGPNFTARLAHFEKKIIPLRNQVSHSWPSLDDETRIIHFVQLGRVTPALASQAGLGRLADNISLDDLLRRAAWTHLFAQDCMAVLESLADNGPPEVAHPKSGLPKAHQNNLRRKDDLSTPDTPPQKPERN